MGGAHYIADHLLNFALKQFDAVNVLNSLEKNLYQIEHKLSDQSSICSVRTTLIGMESVDESGRVQLLPQYFTLNKVFFNSSF